MPDLRLNRRYETALIKTENRYVQETAREFRALRLSLLDALDRNGVGPEFIRAAEHQIEDFTRQVSSIGRAYVEPIDEIVSKHVEGQLEQLSDLVPGIPTAKRAADATHAQRRLLAEQTLTKEPEWALSFRASLRAETQRLQNSRADEAAARKRLLADDAADGRASVWRQGSNNQALAAQLDIWGVAAGVSAIYYAFTEKASGQTFERQAIAAIDERTTDCCLQVHGQIVGLDEPFKLYGTPRFADELMEPPFHWFCRTSVSLYAKTMEQIGITTQEMREAARDELRARQDGREEIHPAHATSRRP